MKQFIAFSILLITLLLIPEFAKAQCAMCQASVESSLREGSPVARNLNMGILYLLVMPYLLFSILFLMWYRGYRQGKAKVEEIIYRRAWDE